MGRRCRHSSICSNSASLKGLQAGILRVNRYPRDSTSEARLLPHTVLEVQPRGSIRMAPALQALPAQL